MGGTKLIKSCLYYLVILILLFFIVTNLSGRIKSIYEVTNICSYTVITGSMKPTINPGDIVIIRAATIDKIKVDDVVTFYKEGDIITHRVIESPSTGILTKGDNNNTIDVGQVTSRDFIGKVIFVIPKVGYLFSPPYNLLAMTIIMVLGGMYVGIKIIRQKYKSC